MSREELKKELYGMVDRMETDEPLLLYWQTSRGTAPRSHLFPKEGTANLMITLKPIRLKNMGDIPAQADYLGGYPFPAL